MATKFYTIGSFLKDVNVEKKNILRADPSAEKEYSPYVMNRILGTHVDCILHINQLNIRPFLSKQMHYDYLIYGLKKRSRYSPKISAKKDEDVSLLMEHYGYSRDRATEILPLINEGAMNEIRIARDIGGR